MFDATGERLFMAGGAGEDVGVHILAAGSGVEQRFLPAPIEADPSTGDRGVDTVALTHDGRIAAAGGQSAANEVLVWDLESGETVARLQGHTAGIQDLGFDSSGRRLVSASWDRTVRIWDLVAGEMLQQLEAAAPVRAAALSSDGRFVVTGHDDFQVRVWRVETGEALRLFEGHRDALLHVGFLDGDHTIASVSRDGEARFWRFDETIEDLMAWTAANRHVPELGCLDRSRLKVRVQCDEDGVHPTRTPLSRRADGAKSAPETTSPLAGDTAARTAPRPTSVLAVPPSVEPTAAPHPVEIHRFDGASPVRDLELDSEGRMAVTGHLDGTVCTWHLLERHPGDCVEPSRNGEATVSGVTFGADGSTAIAAVMQLGAGDDAAQIYAWNPETGEVRNLPLPEDVNEIYDVATIPSSGRIVVTTGGGAQAIDFEGRLEPTSGVGRVGRNGAALAGGPPGALNERLVTARVRQLHAD